MMDQDVAFYRFVDQFFGKISLPGQVEAARTPQKFNLTRSRGGHQGFDRN